MDFFKAGLRVFNYNSPTNIHFHGLMNQGSTCYLNSVLQVLFMTKDFREAVKRFAEENPDTECIDHDLKDLFMDLEKCTTYTYKMTKKLGITKVYEQQDAAEYFEKILRLTSPEASQIFHGKLAHETTCCNCGTQTGTAEQFWQLPLALDSSRKDYSVEGGIEEFFKTSEFIGDNQMYCDRCDDKNDATSKYVIKNHPEVLMLLLKRFDFNYYYMTYVKINCVVDVPYSLQIPKGQTYELYAVVDHYGDLRSGHYSATIKDENGGRWYNFDDTRVTLPDYKPFHMNNTEKSQTAYLLFYRKKTNADTQDSWEVSHSGGVQPFTRNNNDWGQDAENIRDRGEGEDAADDGNNTAASVSTDRLVSEILSAVSTGGGPPPGCENEENPDNEGDDRQNVQDKEQRRNDEHARGEKSTVNYDHDEVVGENKKRSSQSISKDQEKTRQRMSVKRVGVENNEDTEVIKYELVKNKNDTGNDGRAGDTIQKETNDNREWKKDISDTVSDISLRNSEDKMGDEHVQISGSTIHCSVHSEDNGRSHERQKQGVQYPNVSVKKQTKEEERKEDSHNRRDLRQGQLSGSRGERIDQRRHHDQFKRLGDTGPEEKSVRHSGKEHRTGGLGPSCQQERQKQRTERVSGDEGEENEAWMNTGIVLDVESKPEKKRFPKLKLKKQIKREKKQKEKNRQKRKYKFFRQMCCISKTPNGPNDMSEVYRLHAVP